MLYPDLPDEQALLTTGLEMLSKIRCMWMVFHKHYKRQLQTELHDPQTQKINVGLINGRNEIIPLPKVRTK